MDLDRNWVSYFTTDIGEQESEICAIWMLHSGLSLILGRSMFLTTRRADFMARQLEQTCNQFFANFTKNNNGRERVDGTAG
jgi:hypothetical protein